MVLSLDERRSCNRAREGPRLVPKSCQGHVQLQSLIAFQRELWQLFPESNAYDPFYSFGYTSRWRTLLRKQPRTPTVALKLRSTLELAILRTRSSKHAIIDTPTIRNFWAIHHGNHLNAAIRLVKFQLPPLTFKEIHNWQKNCIILNKENLLQ